MRLAMGNWQGSLSLDGFGDSGLAILLLFLGICFGFLVLIAVVGFVDIEQLCVFVLGLLFLFVLHGHGPTHSQFPPIHSSPIELGNCPLGRLVAFKCDE